MTRQTTKSLLASVALSATLFAVACSDDDGGTPVTPDAAVNPDAPVGSPDADLTPDADTTDAFVPPGAPSCAEVATTPTATLSTFPGSYAGDLAAAEANLDIAVACTETNTGFGDPAAAGVDQVVALTGLTPGTRYYAKVDSPGDLAVYVITGCNDAAPGPGDGQCLSFTDAGTSGTEAASFVAPVDGKAYVVIDYYSGTMPPDATSYTLNVTDQGCQADADCAATNPICDVNGATCLRYDFCEGDDTAAEMQSDDAPAGATDVVLVATPVTINANVCANQGLGNEVDWYKFTVAANGAKVTVALQWADVAADLDIDVMDAAGNGMGASYWENPETVQLDYLKAGTYFVQVTRFSPSNSSVVTPYAITFTPGTPALCTSTADCAANFRNEIFRATCSAGACVPFDGAGAVALGGLCDSTDDCDANTAARCTSFPFTAHQDTRAVCTKECTADADCTAVAANAKCTTGLQTNFCTLPCTANNECPSRLGSTPAAGEPWAYLTCTVATGACGQ